MNILLRSGGHASDSACELLAKKLLSKGRHAMARAICRLMHSRGRVCDSSVYDFLFASMLAPSAPSTSEGLSPVGRVRSTREDMRDIGMWRDSEDEGGGGRTRLSGSVSVYPKGTKDMLSAVTDALYLLEEISLATATPAPSAPGPLDSVLTGTFKEHRFRKITNTLLDILVRFEYSSACIEAVQVSVVKLKKNRMG